ncbi:MAG: hypothetical protein AAF495_03825 [Pseudomonadota bacterium]
MTVLSSFPLGQAAVGVDPEQLALASLTERLVALERATAPEARPAARSLLAAQAIFGDALAARAITPCAARKAV